MSFSLEKGMLIYQDLHTHTYFCDGKDSPEEMVLSAIQKGLKIIGICCHSYTDFTSDCCITLENEPVYLEEINRLKEKYKDKITILRGIEKDFHTTKVTVDYDYAIGSKHYFKIDEKYYFIDRAKDEFMRTVEEAFGGDYYLAIERYYESLASIVEKTDCDIIGHFDLVTKYNEGDNLFSTAHPRYVNAYKKAVDKLVKYGKPFEINTGAISRGYRSQPYPAKEIIEYIKEKGGKLILSSDSHSKENIAYQYDKWKDLLG